MAYYEWDSALETGNELIDAQHRSLFALANALALAAEHSFEGDAVADAVYGLAGYVVEHFHDEEELMDSIGYPGTGSHRARHEAFSADVLGFTSRFMSGEEIAPEQLASLVTVWLTTHIMQYDVEAVAYMKQAASARR
jgi:hemerythrin